MRGTNLQDVNIDASREAHLFPFSAEGSHYKHLALQLEERQFWREIEAIAREHRPSDIAQLLKKRYARKRVRAKQQGKSPMQRALEMVATLAIREHKNENTLAALTLQNVLTQLNGPHTLAARGDQYVLLKLHPQKSSGQLYADSRTALIVSSNMHHLADEEVSFSIRNGGSNEMVAWGNYGSGNPLADIDRSHDYVIAAQHRGVPISATFRKRGERACVELENLDESVLDNGYDVGEDTILAATLAESGVFYPEELHAYGGDIVFLHSQLSRVYDGLVRSGFMAEEVVERGTITFADSPNARVEISDGRTPSGVPYLRAGFFDLPLINVKPEERRERSIEERIDLALFQPPDM